MRKNKSRMTYLEELPLPRTQHQVDHSQIRPGATEPPRQYRARDPTVLIHPLSHLLPAPIHHLRQNHRIPQLAPARHRLPQRPRRW